MSSPEASIEEILASIRKTFTDEPESPGPAAAPGATEPRSFGMPPFSSASEGSTAISSSAPLPTPPRSRVSAIDDDLDDLIDKPSSYSSSAPKPPETPPQAAPTGPISPVEAAREKWANLLNPHPHTNGSTAKAAEPKLEQAFQPAPPAPSPSPAPSVAATAAPTSTAPTTTVTSGLFAPRKGGFYPPQDTRPDPLAAMSSAATDTSVAAPAGPAVAAPAPPPPRSSFIPFWQPAAAAATQDAAPDEAPASATSAEAASKAPVADVPAATSRALDDLVAELNGAAIANQEPSPVMPATATPSLSRQAAPIIEQPASKPAMPASASTMAEARTKSAPATLPSSDNEAAATSPSSSSRSFEDVIADMLRPLLEKWIDENMPRIVERALQRDAALGRKPGQ